MNFPDNFSIKFFLFNPSLTSYRFLKWCVKNEEKIQLKVCREIKFLEKVACDWFFLFALSMKSQKFYHHGRDENESRLQWKPAILKKKKMSWNSRWVVFLLKKWINFALKLQFLASLHLLSPHSNVIFYVNKNYDKYFRMTTTSLSDFVVRKKGSETKIKIWIWLQGIDFLCHNHSFLGS